MFENRADIQHDLITRMRRVEGQARGVQRMIEEGAPCQDLLVQLSAMRSAIDRVAMIALGCSLAHDVQRDIASGGRGDDAVQRAVEQLLKYS